MRTNQLKLLFPLYHQGYFSREANVCAWRSDELKPTNADIQSLIKAYQRRDYSPYYSAKLHAQRQLPAEVAIRELTFVYKADTRLLLPGQYSNPLQHHRQTPDGRWYTLFSYEI